MDYIFKEWEEKLKAFESNVEKDLAEIRKCKAEMQELQVEVVNQMKKGYYLRDEQRLVLSAPEIIIGDVDPSGNLNAGSGSTVIVRGNQVGLQGVGNGGQVDLRATIIRETAEDPGIDGQEHVVNSASSVISQAARRYCSTPSRPTTGISMPWPMPSTRLSSIRRCTRACTSSVWPK